MKHYCDRHGGKWVCSENPVDGLILHHEFGGGTTVDFCPFCGFTLDKADSETVNVVTRGRAAGRSSARLDDIDLRLKAVSVSADRRHKRHEGEIAELREDVQSLQDRLELIERMFDWTELRNMPKLIDRMGE